MNSPRILIVDDSAVMRTSLARLVAPVTTNILLAANGEEALATALRDEIDLIISDVVMPRVDGIELCRRLKEHPSARTKPIILLSSFDSDADIERGFRAGATAYLSKSDGAQHILETVQEILASSRHQRNQTILVVDDSTAIRKLVVSSLEDEGFFVHQATDGEQALRLLDQVRPDLILSDIEMPRINGFELCRTVKQNEELRDIPFIVMSSLTDRASMKRMLQNGASAYLCKPFNGDELVILVEKTLADRMRLLLKERERLDTERRLMIEGISGLVSALEARDAYTRGHSEAVGEMVAGMVELIGGNKDAIERARLGGRLHDIGKIGIPDGVLLKPGKLTAEEFEKVKEHPLIGAHILKDIESLRDIREIVLYHHERIDGHGYPEGLQGSLIPQLARFTAVADTYHSLTSNRPYRRGMKQDSALEVIRDVTGTQLCTDAVQVFLRLIEARLAEELREESDETPGPGPKTP